MQQWRLKPFLFGVMVLTISFFLLLMTMATYFSVSYFFTKQKSDARIEVLNSNQLKLNERLGDMEGTALSISTHRLTKELLENTDSPDLYEYLKLQRDVTEWLDTFTYIKPFITSIQIYTDRFVQYEKYGQVGKNRILPMSKIPWKEDMRRFEDVGAQWIPSHGDDYYSDSNAKPTVLTYVLSIYDRKGSVIGYVAVNLLEDSLTRLFFSETKESSPTNRSLMLLDSSGRLMSGMSAQVNAQLINAFQSAIGGIDKPSYGYQPTNVAGSNYLMIYTAQSENHWRLVEFLETKDIYRDTNIIRNIMLLIGTVVLLLVFPVASYLSSRIIRPVPLLLRGFQQIENGNFEANMGKYFIVEFNKLIHGFNKMALELERMIEELEHKNRLKRDLELKVLQSQINPHFLYNTLDMINWAAAMKGNTEISVMVTRLARLFRISLSGGGTFIRLQEELEHARLYAQIQQTRMEDKFVYREQIDPLLKSCYVPKIILQPFIENCIVHGFGDFQEEKAEVSVCAEKMGDHIKITIIDNGAGLEQQRSKSPLHVSGTSGYGIRNIRDRLELYLGSNYKLVISNADARGVKVEMVLPYYDSLEEIKHIAT
ncbi:sensor histidine kinase [Paenibacillus sp. TAB 01]|uniref:sensor histidine kinase n=1 Tax=Paenibacillus sp. TAB 01 TaxID=3368988 RepID=UPI003750EE95